jgi:hypothetical protein
LTQVQVHDVEQQQQQQLQHDEVDFDEEQNPHQYSSIYYIKERPSLYTYNKRAQPGHRLSFLCATLRALVVVHCSNLWCGAKTYYIFEHYQAHLNQAGKDSQQP